ncbi:hypothetical protein K525DRAFT_257026 [Schizophyllum commune Loenen D]|nr:hypothetical protein K525DRAFT_257026 [Schizophyllum commune Loenen D]
MACLSPASYLFWAVSSVLFECFLVYHLWSFDRFKCLRWSSSSSGQAGAFKRFMTYSYLINIPLLIVFSVGFVVIKYQEGYVDYPLYGIIPKPYPLWSQAHKDAVLPLTLIFSFVFSFEIVTHLEELCFWLYLVNSGANQRDWFKSPHFKFWVGGSAVALVYMPLVCALTRQDVLKNEAATFFAGGLGSLLVTAGFIPVLARFPAFLDALKGDDVDMATITRLTKFHEMHWIRIITRLLWVIPILALGADGLKGIPSLLKHTGVVDLLSTCSAFGCMISSGITLVIFFPRSIEGELRVKDAARARRAKVKTRGSMLSDRKHLLPDTKQIIKDAKRALGSASPKRGASFDMEVRKGVLAEELPSLPVSRAFAVDAPGSGTPRGWSDTPPPPAWSATASPAPSPLPSAPYWGGASPASGLSPIPPSPSPSGGSHFALGDPPITMVVPSSPAPNTPLTPLRRQSIREEMGGPGVMRIGSFSSGSTAVSSSHLTVSALTERNLNDHNRALVNPAVHNFTSPIDVLSYPRPGQSNASRFTFTRR